jgi:hypothetical protein
MGMAVSGIYHLDDSGNMCLEIKHHEAPPEVINLRIKIEEDKLTLIYCGKEIDDKYKRVK